MPLHTKYRPATFDEFYGNDETVETLKIRLAGQDRPQALLFTGPAGCGKTTLARIVASVLEVHPGNIEEYNTANTRGIDTIRNLDVESRLAPMSGGRFKFYLLDECHKLTNEAQNALLKLLEEPPKSAFFTLCTTNPEKLLDTFDQRCQRYKVGKLSLHLIRRLLLEVCEKEGIPDYPPQVLTKISEVADGSPRRALMYLDKVIELIDETTAMSVLYRDTVDEEGILELCQTLLLNQEGKWEQVRNILLKMPEAAEEPEKVRYSILKYMSKVALGSDAPRVIQMIGLFFDSYMYVGRAGLVWSCYKACKL